MEGFDKWSLLPGVLSNSKANIDTVDSGTLLRFSRKFLTIEMSDKLCIVERL